MTLYESLLERTNGREYSNYFMMSCIFHGSDIHPSLMVHEDGFKCLSCNKRGSLKQLENKLGSHFSPTRNDAVSNILPSWRKWGDDLDEIAHKAHAMLKRYPQFAGYYKRRKVDEFIEKGMLGYCDGWAIMPIFDINGKIVDILCRAVKGKGDTRYVVRPSETTLKPLYVPSWMRVQEAERIFVVYGIFDAISLELIGLPVVTGITGKSLNEISLQSLSVSLQNRSIKFTIIPDYHEEVDAHRLANKLGWKARVKELSYPEDCKDVDEVRVKYGNEYLKTLIGVN